jgi:hypothetical protein
MSTAIWLTLALVALVVLLVIIDLARHGISRWIRSCWQDPYERNLNKRIRVRVVGGPEGREPEQGVPQLFAVSRHGLVRPPITCPSCGPLGDLSANDIIETRWGEAVVCKQCHAYLLASPDDDVDDADPTQEYDENVYHKFIRPATSDRPRQRTLRRAPEVGDWVVITEHIAKSTTAGAPPQDLWGGEGRVESLNLIEGTAKVSLGGVSGLAGSDYGGVFADLPLRALAVMANHTLRVGDEVRVVRGGRRGHTGRIQSITLGKPSILFGDLQVIEVPIERLIKVQEVNE